MPARLRIVGAAEVTGALDRVATADEVGETPDKTDLKMLVKHYMAVLEARAPGHSVEVRVPPYAAVQVIPGVRHTRGTPPAVVETDASTWIAMASGRITWSEAAASGKVAASGQRADLAPYLPLT